MLAYKVAYMGLYYLIGTLSACYKITYNSVLRTSIVSV